MPELPHFVLFCIRSYLFLNNVNAVNGRVIEDTYSKSEDNTVPQFTNNRTLKKNVSDFFSFYKSIFI